MKKQKPIILSACCILTVLFLYNHIQAGKEIITSETSADSIENENIEFPTEYKKDVSSTLCFDADVVVPKDVDVNNIYWGTATSAPLDSKKINTYLFGNSTDVMREKNTKENPAVNRQGEEIDWEIAEDENGRYMLLEENSYLSFSDDPEYTYIENCIWSDKRGGSDNLDVYSTTDNLDFMERTQAKENIKQAFLEMGIDTEHTQCTSYAMDLETMKTQENILMQENAMETSDKNPKWDKLQEGYYFFMRQTFQGLPVYAITDVNRGIWDNPADSPLQIFYNSQGVAGISILNYFKMEKSEEKMQLASFDKIVDTIEEKYEDIINANKLTVKRMELVEFPVYKKDGIYQMQPIWMCYLQVTDENGNNPETLYIQMPVYADTAKEAMEIET
ncbi:MAG: hypothetical protein J6A92_05590 [Lachnospiraceae bacterium]|nr:hypothetical protein [Lachnospiraceae bacterium]